MAGSSGSSRRPRSPRWETAPSSSTSAPTRIGRATAPGSLHIPRTVLEWRLDPDSRWRSPHAGGLETHVVLICNHGYASVLAAATLADLGFTRVGDVVGGYEAWRAAGLPTMPAPPAERAPGELPGMRPPDKPGSVAGDPGNAVHEARSAGTG